MGKNDVHYERRSKGNQDVNAQGKSKQVLTAKDKGKGKVDEVSKPKRRVQPSRGGTLVINEPVATREKTPVPSESSSESESSTEDDAPINPSRESNAQIAKDCRKALKKVDILQTRWVDVDLLTRMGIIEDVRKLLGHMGLSKLMEMDYACYPAQVIELISTFEFYLREGATDPKLMGGIEFFYNGSWRKLTIAEVCEAYGFPLTLGQKIEARESQDRRVWKMIGKGDYIPGRAKAKLIGNPIVRYVQKLLSHTLCARYEGDRLVEEEIALLSNGLRSMFELHFLDEGVLGYEDINIGVLLAKKILSLKTWALKSSRAESKLLIGGFLTPLLRASKVRLNNPLNSPRLKLDFPTLRRMGFFTGNDGNRLRYKFVGSSSTEHTVVLPNEVITSLVCTENLSFATGEFLVTSTNDPAEALLSMSDRLVSEASRRSASDLPLGSPRYYFPTFKGKVRNEADEFAIETFKKSQRWHKWSARSLHNIKRSYKKQVKAFKEEISGLKSIIKTHLFKKDEAAFDQAMEDVRRHSTSNVPTSSSRKRRTVPSPSPPTSDNASIHLSSDEEESP